MLSRLLPRHWPLGLQLGVPLTAIVILSIGLVAFLDYFNFQKSYGLLTQERYLVVGKDARQVVESGLNVGLSPEANQGLLPFFERLQGNESGLRFIAVVDQAGRAQVGSGGLPDGQPWRRPAHGAQDDGRTWQQQDANLFYLGLPFRNSFGVVIGSLVLGYERSEVDGPVQAMRGRLLRIWLLVSLAVALAAPYLVWWLTRRMSRDIDLAAQAVDQALAPQAPMLPALPALGGELSRDIPEFIRLSRESVGLNPGRGREGGA